MPALAQFAALALQCAMCYQTAASQGAKGMSAMNLGIVVLLVPPMAIIGCITWAVYQRRETASGERRPAEPDPPVPE